MKIKLLFFLSAFLMALVTSCFKEDEMIPAHQKGNVTTDTIPMTDTYRFQIYFDLSDSISRSQNPKTITDIGFDCSMNGAFVILNTADFVKAWDLGSVPFGAAYDTTGAEWKFDKSTGDPDSLAIGKWYNVAGADTNSNGHVYVLNRGLDELGNSLGFVQITIDSLSGGIWYFRWAGLDGSNPKSVSLQKNNSVSYTWYSFSDGGRAEDPEPQKETWDILFTQYTTLLYTDEGAAYPYLVTGVLLNRYNVMGVMDTTHTFEEITIETALAAQLKNDLDVIGWEWKKYSFETGGYTVLFNRNYIISDPAGLFYKLRFVGFYNASGAKGYPVIEYQEL